MEDRKGLGPTGSEASGAAPRIARELLRTPLFKDLIVTSLNDAGSGNPRELVKTLIWEDSAFTLGVLGKLPQGIGYLAAFLDELGQQLQNVPPEILKEFVFLIGENLDKEAIASVPRSFAPLLNKLLWEDPENRTRLKEGAFEAVSALMRLLTGFLGKDGVAETGETEPAPVYPDPEALGELITALFRWLGKAVGTDDHSIELIREKKIAFTREVLETADFGVIRQALADRARANRPVTENLLSLLISDPVRFASLFKMLSTLLNTLFNILGTAIASLEYPPEILASAVMNLLSDLETAEISKLVNSVSLLIKRIHEGSLILGREEPLFRPVFRNLLEGVLDDLDESTVAAALQALLEDSEVIISVSADLMLQKPELLKKTFPALLLGLNAALRGAVYLLTQINQLPPEAYRRLGRELEEKADFREIGALINALIGMVNRILAENPELPEMILTRIHRTIDHEALKSLGGTLLMNGLSFVRKEELFKITPETAGTAINALLALLNQELERDPQKLQKTVNSYLGQVDYAQLDATVTSSAALLAGTMEANPQFAGFVMNWFFTIVRAVIKTVLKPKNWGRLFRSAKKKNGKRRELSNGVGRAG